MARLSPMNIGLRIIQLRVEKGWNQSELADALGIDQSTVSKIERGVSKANMETLSKIAKVFGVNLSALVDDGMLEEIRDQKYEALTNKLKELEEQLTKAKNETLPTTELHDEERRLIAEIRAAKIPDLIRDLRLILIAAPQLLEATLKAVRPSLTKPPPDVPPPRRKRRH